MTKAKLITKSNQQALQTRVESFRRNNVPAFLSDIKSAIYPA
ncbi:MAG: hypothetical protein WAW75_03035 [Gallionella sp.]